MATGVLTTKTRKRPRAAPLPRNARARRRKRGPIEAPSAFCLPDDAVERALLSRESPAELEAYFGEREYAELRELAQRAASRSVRGGPRALILPGIMGSRLGTHGKLLDDVIWIDPIDIAAGNLPLIALHGKSSRIVPLGVVLFAYLKLKLCLKIDGIDADFYAYDWRQGLEVIAESLVERLAAESAREVHLVCHSMGGLVARAALEQGANNVGKLIMLGTPNFGSFVPVQALTGTHSLVQKLGFVDAFHDLDELCGIFNTFPGLYSCMAAPEKFKAFDLYDLANWPRPGPLPRAELLRAARDTQRLLAPAREGFFLIAGVNQDTVTDLSIQAGQFVYTVTPDGDGTVPLAMAELPGARTFYVEETHGSLPNHRLVARAVGELINQGETEALPSEPPRRRDAAPRLIRAAELRQRAPVPAARSARELSPSEQRRLIEELVAPDARSGPEDAKAVEIGNLRNVSVLRNTQQRLDVVLARGSVTEVAATAVVLGLFSNVAPGGAARAIDDRIAGAITELSARRMFSGNLGEIFVLPTGRHPVRPDLVVFAGLGPFDQFRSERLEGVAENVIRTLIRSGIDELATVILSGGSRQGTQEALGESLEHMVRGYVRGLLDSDARRQFRRIVICEYDAQRFEALRRELYRLTGTSLFDRMAVSFDEIELPPAPAVAAPSRVLASSADPAYLTVRQEPASKGRIVFESALLTAGGKATVISGRKSLPEAALERALSRLDSAVKSANALDKFGAELSAMVLDDAVLAVLPSVRHLPLIVVHDELASRIPWEALRIEDWSFASGSGLSRKYLGRDLSIAKWLEARREDGTLSVLLVVNPTLDLDGAEREGERVQQLLSRTAAARIEVRHGSDARKERLAADLRSGLYDVVHYAGHAFFDPAQPARSGILCASEQVLSGADLAGLGNLPSLVFFNACEAGRIRGRRPRGRGKKPSHATNRALRLEHGVRQNVGLAEAFLRGGVANYLGTYWPVGDGEAATFADCFYSRILDHVSLGAAVLAARTAVREKHSSSADWADYVLYGSHEFVLKA